MSIMIKWGKNSAYVLIIGRKLPWCQSVYLIYVLREYYKENQVVDAKFIFGLFRDKNLKKREVL